MCRRLILPPLLVLATVLAGPSAMGETRSGAANVPAVKAERLKPASLAGPEQLTSPAATALAAGAPLVLAAPPRDSTEEGHRIFDPVARYLATVLGRPVVHKHPSTWGGYQADMQAGACDIVFDGPHFNSWRIASRGHNVLLKIPGDFVYTAFVHKGDANFTQIKQLAGRKVCTHAPPNLGTLILYNEFDNPHANRY